MIESAPVPINLGGTIEAQRQLRADLERPDLFGESPPAPAAGPSSGAGRFS
jgi:hypothetical protein